MASPMGWEEAKERLRKIREEQVRSSEEVVDIWEDVIADFSHKMGDELWIIYEQVCVAALDCARIDIAQVCLESLGAQFTDSLRVKRLKGLFLEALERYEQASHIYEDILEEDETNSLIRKRLIGILKAQNKTAEAIKELTRYLEKFSVDYEAWLELCDLYILEQDYSKAAYCMEELVMSNPHNHLYHQKYAEIKYTHGGYDNMELARSYFSHAVKLNPNNMRALYGLFMAASNLASNPKSNAKVKTDNTRYASWAAQQIAQKYQGDLAKKSSSQVKAIESMLDSLQISHTSS